MAALAVLGLLAACGRSDDSEASRGGIRPPVASVASAAASTIVQAGEADRRFIATAAAIGLFEVQLGQLAGARAADAAVKGFATMLVDDHTGANNELAQLASVRGVTLPAQPSRDGQAELRKLARESGGGFDRDFVDQAIRSHRRDVDDFEAAARRSQDDELKSWIERTLPTLRQHLGEAEKLVATAVVAPVASGVARSGASTAPRSPTAPGRVGSGVMAASAATGPSTGPRVPSASSVAGAAGAERAASGSSASAAPLPGAATASASSSAPASQAASAH